MGSDLLARAGDVESVALSGVAVQQIVSVSNNLIRVRAGAGSADKVGVAGSVLIVATSKAEVMAAEVFTYNTASAISSHTPVDGTTGTRVTIEGTRLFGEGTAISLVSLAGVQAHIDNVTSLGGDNVRVVVRAGSAGNDQSLSGHYLL